MTELAGTTDHTASPVEYNPGGDSSGLEKIEKQEGKYLTFTLPNEEYGIGILKIKEIIGMMAITPVPQTPDFVKGVINLRGKVIPVIDLRLRFGMEAIDYTERTCIIVVEIEGAAGTVQDRHRGGYGIRSIKCEWRRHRGHTHIRHEVEYQLHPRNGQNERGC